MATSTGVVDSAFIYIMAFSFLLFFGIIFTMVYFVVRYRRSRNPKAAAISGNVPLEIIWFVLPTVLALSMFFYGLTGFQFLRHPPADSTVVKVHSRQWSWLFEYANGMRSADLVAPLERDVRLELTSDDVIHGFYVPAFRIQQDAVPSLKTHAWFRATQPGTYDIFCTQYCGVGHSEMLSRLIVVTQDQYDAWYAGKPVQVPGITLPSAAPAGQELLRQRGCLACHTTDGSRIIGPTFKGLYESTVDVTTGGKQRSVEADEEYIRKSILDPGADIVVGFQNIMPSGRGIVSDQEIKQIVQYLETLK